MRNIADIKRDFHAMEVCLAQFLFPVCSDALYILGAGSDASMCK